MKLSLDEQPYLHQWGISDTEMMPDTPFKCVSAYPALFRSPHCAQAENVVHTPTVIISQKTDTNTERSPVATATNHVFYKNADLK